MHLRLDVIVLGSLLLSGVLTPAQDSKRALTYCFDEVSRLELPDEAGDRLPGVHGPDDLTVQPIGPAEVEVWRSRTKLGVVHLESLSNPNVVVVWNDDGKGLAINYSDGGGLGGWHTRIFVMRDGGLLDKMAAVDSAVRDFKPRHYCAARGDNVQTLKWITANEVLLLTSVYPTSDCGPDLGHVEGYLVDVLSGRIIKGRLTFDQLAQRAGVCLENVE